MGVDPDALATTVYSVEDPTHLETLILQLRFMIRDNHFPSSPASSGLLNTIELHGDRRHVFPMMFLISATVAHASRLLTDQGDGYSRFMVATGYFQTHLPAPPHAARRVLRTGLFMVMACWMTVVSPSSAQTISPEMDRRIDALVETGNGRLRANDTAGAAAAFEEAGNVLRRLAQAHSRDPKALRRFAEVLNRLVVLRYRQGDQFGALSALGEAVSHGRHLVSILPGDTAWQHHLAVLLIQRTQMRAGQDLAADLADLAEAVGILRRLVMVDPARDDWRRTLSSTLHQLADRQRRAGQRRAAMASIDEALAIDRQQSGNRAGDPEALDQLIGLLSLAADLRRSEGAAQQALPLYLELVGLHQRRLMGQPDNADWLNDLAASLTHLGEIYLTLGKGDLASEAFDRQIAVRKRLVRGDPGNPALLLDMAKAHERIARAKMTAGDRTGALQDFQTGFVLRRQVLRRTPQDLKAWSELAAVMARIGDVHRQAGDGKAALESYEKVRKILVSLAGSAPADPRWIRERAAILDKIARSRALIKDLGGAIEAARTAVRLRRQLITQDPLSPRWQADLAISLIGLGDIRRGEGDLEGAVADYQRVVEIHRQLTVQFPDDSRWQRGLAVSLLRLGTVNDRLGHRGAARNAFGEANHILGSLATDQGTVDDAASRPGRVVKWQAELVYAIVQYARSQEDEAGRRKVLENGLALLENLQAIGRLADKDKHWLDVLTRERDMPASGEAVPGAPHSGDPEPAIQETDS